ncbi:hypothetical protein ACNKHV_16100 [Shigella flexneri]
MPAPLQVNLLRVCRT